MMEITAETLRKGESVRLELKLMLPRDSEKYLRAVVAFANCQGGIILFGVDDRTHQAVGIEDDALFPMMDSIANAISDACVPQIIPEIEPRSVDGRNLIAVYIRPHMDRPYYLKGKGKRAGTYVRVGATSRPATESKILELEMEGRHISWDELPCRGFKISDEQVQGLCRAIGQLRKQAKLPEREIDVSQLVNWKLLLKEGNEQFASNAFALLTSDVFQFAQIQCALFKGRDRVTFLDKREYSGPLYEQIEQAVNFVLRNIRLGVTIGKVLREERYELPVKAIREMIVNAVCHRSYLDESCVQVAIYDDRLEVTSPGGLYNGLTVEDMLSGHSKIRNRAIANTLMQMGIIENWGTGIKRILQLSAEYHLQVPKITVSENFFRIELFRRIVEPHEEFVGTTGGKNTETGGKNIEIGGKNTEIGGKNIEVGGKNTEVGGKNIEIGGNETSTKANNQIPSRTSNEDISNELLRLIENNRQITVSSLALSLKISIRRTERELRRLRQQGILIRHGAPRNGFWEIATSAKDPKD